MKKHILALAVVGALGVSSLTAASPSNAPAVAVQAEIGHWVGRIVTGNSATGGLDPYSQRVVRTFVCVGARIGRAIGSKHGPAGAELGARIGAR